VFGRGFFLFILKLMCSILQYLRSNGCFGKTSAVHKCVYCTHITQEKGHTCLPKKCLIKSFFRLFEKRKKIEPSIKRGYRKTALTNKSFLLTYSSRVNLFLFTVTISIEFKNCYFMHATAYFFNLKGTVT